MAEREIRKEIDILKEEISAIRNEIRARLGISKGDIVTGLKVIVIGIVAIIGLKLVWKPVGALTGFLWRHKIVCLVPPAGYYIFIKSQK
ncbi:MAG: hypothetical protein U9P49_07235 [Thermodesulfobacteriota bacterium]|nr:hypothetical protein [Thermodesulfobacteriota bacterium]